MRLAALMIMLVLVLPTASAYHMMLIAVTEENGEFVGSPADVTLDVIPGMGRVYIDTYPLSKFDTQISTRLARDVACTYIDEDCTDKDFIYTLRSQSSIIGGPSAGAAIALLTIASLKGWELPLDVVITGTINSGGVIGPVGGIDAKIRKADELNFSTIYVPAGEFLKSDIYKAINAGNETISIKVKEVDDIGEVLYDLYGFEPEKGEIKIDPGYERIMGEIASKMCSRTKSLLEEIGGDESYEAQKARNYSQRADETDGLYYTKASFCFTANLDARKVLLMNISDSYADQLMSWLTDKIADFDSRIGNYSPDTLTDFQTDIIVRSRLSEATKQLDNAYIAKEEGDGPGERTSLAQGIERYYSALYWGDFFYNDDDKLVDLTVQEDTCYQKTREAEERYQYLNMFLGIHPESIEESLTHAVELSQLGEYGLCVFEASKAKAESDIMLSLMQLDEADLSDLLDAKLEVVERSIGRQIAKKPFPIIGYSYYEYSKSLREDQPYLSLLFAEYALEFSNLDEYFPPRPKLMMGYFERGVLIFLLGGITGAAAAILLSRRRR